MLPTRLARVNAALWMKTKKCVHFDEANHVSSYCAGDVRVGSDSVSVRSSESRWSPTVGIGSSVVRRRRIRAPAYGWRPRPTVQLWRPQLDAVRLRRPPATSVVQRWRRVSARCRYHAPDQRVLPQRTDRQAEPADGRANRPSVDQQTTLELLLRFRRR